MADLPVGSRLFSRSVGLLAGFLTLTSPFFLVLSGTLDSDPLTLVLSLGFCLAWLDLTGLLAKPDLRPRWPAPQWLSVPLAGLSLGLLNLTRPLTGIGLGIPFFIHGLILLIKGKPDTRWRVLATGAISVAISVWFFAWQFGVTGSLFKDPYTLWWPSDRVGFGPGIGISPGGHTLLEGVKDAGIMLKQLSKDLFGWRSISWLFLPFGLWAMRRNRAAWLVMSIFVSLVIVYLAYWAAVTRYGPRYYYEGLFGLTLVSAAGIMWLVERARVGGWHRLRLGLLVGLVTGLCAYNLTTYLPKRLEGNLGIYGIHRNQLAPFQTAKATVLSPALVFVHINRDWGQYAGLLELEDPWITSPFIFAWSHGPVRDAALAQQFPGRRILDYYPDNGRKLLESPLK